MNHRCNWISGPSFSAHCYKLRFVSPSIWYVLVKSCEILTLKVLGDGAFEKWWGYKDGGFTNGINAHIKEIKRGPLPFPQCEKARKEPSMNQEVGPHLNFPSSRTGNKFQFLKVPWPMVFYLSSPNRLTLASEQEIVLHLCLGETSVQESLVLFASQ